MAATLASKGGSDPDSNVALLTLTTFGTMRTEMTTWTGMNCMEESEGRIYVGVGERDRLHQRPE